MVMERMDNIQNKIEFFSLEKSDIDNLIDDLQLESRDLEGPSKNIIEDAIQWFKVFSLLLGKYENGNFSIVSTDWREENIEFEKLKRTIDDMGYDEIFAYTTWTLGGNCHLRVIDKAEYLKFLYEHIGVLISKVGSVLEKIGIKIQESKKEKIQEKLAKEVINEKAPIKEQETYEKEIVDTEQKKFEEEKGNEVFNTNLKHIEKELEYTVKKLQRSKKPQKEIEKWVSQFKTDKERIYALKILNNIRYYDYEDIIELYIRAHKNLCREFKDKPNMTHFLFIPVGDAGSSGSRCAPEYRMFNNLPKTQIINSSDIKTIQEDKFKYVVFIDDFIGTGDTASAFFLNIDFELLKSKKIERFFFVVWIAFEEGIKSIEENYKDIKIIYAELLNDKDKAFSNESTIFSEEEKAEAKTIFENYGEILYEEYPLGYKNFSALISFKTRTPNDTLPVIWSDARDWIPLFKRYY